MKWPFLPSVSVLGVVLAVAAPLHAQSTGSVLLDTMSAELSRASATIGKDIPAQNRNDAHPPYYISYA
ncbi:MAG: hypothetical protein JOZ33_00395, partial [Acidobacteriaceae bacterium]|nr:hypothetical protein [Acidobacteriaceae bacterium]